MLNLGFNFQLDLPDNRVVAGVLAWGLPEKEDLEAAGSWLGALRRWAFHYTWSNSQAAEVLELNARLRLLGFQLGLTVDLEASEI